MKQLVFIFIPHITVNGGTSETLEKLFISYFSTCHISAENIDKVSGRHSHKTIQKGWSKKLLYHGCSKINCYSYLVL